MLIQSTHLAYISGCPNEEDEYILVPLAQDLSSEQIICYFSGNTENLSGNMTYTEITDIDISGAPWRQICISPQYGINLTYEEIKSGKWNEIRSIRNQYLFLTDKYVVGDYDFGYSEDEIDSALEYRQSLRDLPQSYENPFDVSFPASPSGMFD